MIATASAADYRRTIAALVDADAGDAIIALFVPPLMTAATDAARRTKRFWQGPSSACPSR